MKYVNTEYTQPWQTPAAKMLPVAPLMAVVPDEWVREGLIHG